MPNYPFASGSSTLSPVAPNPVTTATPLGRGESVYLFGVLSAAASQLPPSPGNVTGEQPAPPQASVAINVGDYQEQGPAPGVSFEFQFSAAPGAWTAVIQEADTDNDVSYITPATATYTISSSAQFLRVDLIPTGGRFMRVILQTRTNAVALVCKATRLQ
jgi:hypothetical protein